MINLRLNPVLNLQRANNVSRVTAAQSEQESFLADKFFEAVKEANQLAKNSPLTREEGTIANLDSISLDTVKAWEKELTEEIRTQSGALNNPSIIDVLNGLYGTRHNGLGETVLSMWAELEKNPLFMQIEETRMFSRPTVDADKGINGAETADISELLLDIRSAQLILGHKAPQDLQKGGVTSFEAKAPLEDYLKTAFEKALLDKVAQINSINIGVV